MLPQLLKSLQYELMHVNWQIIFIYKPDTLFLTFSWWWRPWIYLHEYKLTFDYLVITITFHQVDLQIGDVIVTVCHGLGGLSFHIKALAVKEIIFKKKVDRNRPLFFFKTLFEHEANEWNHGPWLPAL